MNKSVSQSTDKFQAILEVLTGLRIVLTGLRSLGSTVGKINTARDPQDIPYEHLTIHALPSCSSLTLTVLPSIAWVL